MLSLPVSRTWLVLIIITLVLTATALASSQNEHDHEEDENLKDPDEEDNEDDDKESDEDDEDKDKDESDEEGDKSDEDEEDNEDNGEDEMKKKPGGKGKGKGRTQERPEPNKPDLDDLVPTDADIEITPSPTVAGSEPPFEPARPPLDPTLPLPEITATPNSTPDVPTRENSIEDAEAEESGEMEFIPSVASPPHVERPITTSSFETTHNASMDNDSFDQSQQIKDFPSPIPPLVVAGFLILWSLARKYP